MQGQGVDPQLQQPGYMQQYGMTLCANLPKKIIFLFLRHKDSLSLSF
jgi:hypothetical protein